jgi:hypothetical protein
MSQTNDELDIFRPKGMWSIIVLCPKCGRFCQDTLSMSRYAGRKFAKNNFPAPRNNGSYFFSKNICSECEKIRFCDLCEKEGTTKNIRYRADVACWNNSHDKSHLCFSCYNKVRAVVRKEEKAKEVISQIKLLEKEIKNVRKNQNNG